MFSSHPHNSPPSDGLTANSVHRKMNRSVQKTAVSQPVTSRQLPAITTEQRNGHGALSNSAPQSAPKPSSTPRQPSWSPLTAVEHGDRAGPPMNRPSLATTTDQSGRSLAYRITQSTVPAELMDEVGPPYSSAIHSFASTFHQTINRTILLRTYSIYASSPSAQLTANITDMVRVRGIEILRVSGTHRTVWSKPPDVTFEAGLMQEIKNLAQMAFQQVTNSLENDDGLDEASMAFWYHFNRALEEVYTRHLQFYQQGHNAMNVHGSSRDDVDGDANSTANHDDRGGDYDDDDELDEDEHDVPCDFKVGRFISLPDGSLFDQATLLPITVQVNGQIRTYLDGVTVDWDDSEAVMRLNKRVYQIKYRAGNRDRPTRLPWTDSEIGFVRSAFRLDPDTTEKDVLEKLNSHFEGEMVNHNGKMHVFRKRSRIALHSMITRQKRTYPARWETKPKSNQKRADPARWEAKRKLSQKRKLSDMVEAEGVARPSRAAKTTANDNISRTSQTIADWQATATRLAKRTPKKRMSKQRTSKQRPSNRKPKAT